MRVAGRRARLVCLLWNRWLVIVRSLVHTVVISWLWVVVLLSCYVPS